MAKQVFALNIWSWVGFGLLFTGLLWGAFAWSRTRPSLLAEGFEAYRSRDYVRAAELGKRQLIKTPEDASSASAAGAFHGPSGP